MKKDHDVYSVLKMGNKFGLYLPMAPTDIKRGDIVEIIISKGAKTFNYITRFNKVIALRGELVNSLNLKHKDDIKLSISKIKPYKKSENLFYKDKIDLLHLLPNKTSLGYEIICKIFKKDGREWLTLWYSHSRGSCMQINLVRFVDIDKLGRLLGLFQAEGTKGNFNAVEFANSSIKEHKDFLDYLNHIGVTHDIVSVDCVYYDQIKEAKERIKEYENETGIKINNIYSGNISKYGLGFKFKVRNTVFSNLILSSMDKIRRILINSDWDKNMRSLAEAFFAKLLSGDGNIDLDVKDRNIPQGRIKITDMNKNYLADYSKLMSKFGFKPTIYEKYIMVRSSFNLPQAKWLLQIGAFKKNPNEKKLELFINSRETPSK